MIVFYESYGSDGSFRPGIHGASDRIHLRMDGLIMKSTAGANTDTFVVESAAGIKSRPIDEPPSDSQTQL